MDDTEVRAAFNKLQSQSGPQKYMQLSRRRLNDILEKKFKTSFVGAIDKFETNFGYLWGHGIPVSELTPEQKKFRDIWNLTREQIFTNGNNQIRATHNELSEYSVVWNRHMVNFSVKNEENGNV